MGPAPRRDQDGGARRPGVPLLLAAWLSTVGLFLVVIVGFVDTFTGSALGCGRSFPLCHGSLFPSDNLKAIIEWSHRSLAAGVGLLVGLTVIWAWARAGRFIEVRVLGLVSVGFIFIESAVGALAVLSPESQAVIAVHLGIALTAFAATALLTRVLVAVRRSGAAGLARPAGPPTLTAWTWAMMLYMYLAVYLGAYVAGTDSGSACLTWPLCPLGKATWSLGNPVTIDLLHRAVALIGAVLAVQLFAVARQVRVARPDLAGQAHTVLVFIVLQIASGVLLVRTHLSLEATVVHVAVATLLFTAVAGMALGVLPEARGPRRGGASPAGPAHG